MGKFGVVGALAYVADSAVLILLERRGWGPLTAKTIATVVAATLAFAGNRFWTWRHRARSGRARESGLFSLFTALGFGIALAVLGVSCHWLVALWPQIFQTSLAVFISANVVGLAAGTVFRFWSYRRYVFRAPAPAERYPNLAAATPAQNPRPGN